MYRLPLCVFHPKLPVLGRLVLSADSDWNHFPFHCVCEQIESRGFWLSSSDFSSRHFVLCLIHVQSTEIDQIENFTMICGSLTKMIAAHNNKSRRRRSHSTTVLGSNHGPRVLRVRVKRYAVCQSPTPRIDAVWCPHEVHFNTNTHVWSQAK